MIRTKLGNNVTELAYSNGTVKFVYSYNTVVGYIESNNMGEVVASYRTKARFSQTTTKHCSKYLGRNCQEVEQSLLEELARSYRLANYEQELT